ncbi:hypothetical protein [Pedobacter boryungensis]|uniref:Adenylosuccinate lyase n=1 Tax=Pedobacter boryungensis TaxID=869962 RepID=A0ABX2DCJ4_9SPHI|nr:hypothetical protein [Pedobacter boryungensis]NQX31254.1 hypothetical protein [Pedobacter boryungensis]
MQNDFLLEAIKTTLQKTKVYKLANIASENEFLVKDLIDLTFHKEEQVGFRAAWILENIYTNHFERFLPQAHYFLKKFSEQNNLSARRHYTKILALITKKNAPLAIKEIINNYQIDALVETVFSWLIDEKVPVAVKSHCLNILHNFSSKRSWIKDELIQTMDYLVDKESIAFYAKVKQIRKQLNKTDSSQ